MEGDEKDGLVKNEMLWDKRRSSREGRFGYQGETLDGLFSVVITLLIPSSLATPTAPDLQALSWSATDLLPKIQQNNPPRPCGP